MRVPTVSDVGRIAAVSDPVIRNLQITQCYFELSQALRGSLAGGANWCTFATWASKQAGRSIRGEDLAGSLEDLVGPSPELQLILDEVQTALERLGKRRDVRTIRENLFSAIDPRVALQRAADAVARGNLKVFEEIAREFARFLGIRGSAGKWEPARLNAFCESLRPGEAPDGQRLLRDAFAAYAAAGAATDPKTRAELMYFANLLIGLHEQTRLQPEIAAAMNASFDDDEAVRQRLLKALLPGFWVRLRVQAARLLGRPLPLDTALDRFIHRVRQRVRQMVTDSMLTLHISDGHVLRLGQNIATGFAPELAQLSHDALTTLLAEIDPTPDSTRDSGARDWADFPDRMHFILDFFRCYHAWQPLFDPPFTEVQLLEIGAGRHP